MISRRRALAGAFVLIACVQYFVAEAIAAAAWRDPPYSFLRNYISDLGATVCTAALCSPLASVMNAGFVVDGVLSIAAVLLLAPLLTSVVWRRALVALAVVHGVGSIVVGVVHSAPASAAGTPRLHFIGACLAILGGNLALCAAGLGLRRARVGPSFAIILVGLGACGLCAGLALLGMPFRLPGLLERLAVDPITVGEVLVGLALLTSRDRLRL